MLELARIDSLEKSLQFALDEIRAIKAHAMLRLAENFDIDRATINQYLVAKFRSKERITVDELLAYTKLKRSSFYQRASVLKISIVDKTVSHSDAVKIIATTRAKNKLKELI